MKSIHINNLQSITFFKTKLESRGDHHIPNLSREFPWYIWTVERWSHWIRISFFSGPKSVQIRKLHAYSSIWKPEI